MILLTCTLAWSLLTPLQGSDGNPNLQKDQLLVLYPKLLANETITCECGSMPCDWVYWLRTIPAVGQVQFLGMQNNAHIFRHGTNVSKQRFEFKKKDRTTFLLRIVNVTKEDAGVYACVLTDRKAKEVLKSGILLLPGVIPPTPPPTTTTTRAPVKSVCRCSPHDGCGSWVLWPLVGTMATLAVALLCVLYYFSRLPKKCRHRFVKKRLMT